VAAHKQIRIDANADFEFWARWLRPPPPLDSGLPYILSDAWLQVRVSGASAVLLEATLGNNRVTLDSANGWAKIVIPKSAMTSLSAGAALYDLVVTRSSDGRVRRLLWGDVIISTGITHA